MSAAPDHVMQTEQRRDDDIVNVECVTISKLLIRPGGKIKRGAEHEITGKSPVENLPEHSRRALHEACAPEHHFANWRGVMPVICSDWAKGAFLYRAVQVDRQYFGLFSRLQARSEAGDGEPGRMFTHCATLIVDNWYPGLIPIMAKRLFEEKDGEPDVVSDDQRMLRRPVPVYPEDCDVALAGADKRPGLDWQRTPPPRSPGEERFVDPQIRLSCHSWLKSDGPVADVQAVAHFLSENGYASTGRWLSFGFGIKLGIEGSNGGFAMALYGDREDPLSHRFEMPEKFEVSFDDQHEPPSLCFKEQAQAGTREHPNTGINPQLLSFSRSPEAHGACATLHHEQTDTVPVEMQNAYNEALAQSANAHMHPDNGMDFILESLADLKIREAADVSSSGTMPGSEPGFEAESTRDVLRVAEAQHSNLLKKDTDISQHERGHGADETSDEEPEDPYSAWLLSPHTHFQFGRSVITSPQPTPPSSKFLEISGVEPKSPAGLRAFDKFNFSIFCEKAPEVHMAFLKHMASNDNAAYQIILNYVVEVSILIQCMNYFVFDKEPIFITNIVESILCRSQVLHSDGADTFLKLQSVAEGFRISDHVNVEGQFVEHGDVLMVSGQEESISVSYFATDWPLCNAARIVLCEMLRRYRENYFENRTADEVRERRDPALYDQVVSRFDFICRLFDADYAFSKLEGERNLEIYRHVRSLTHTICAQKSRILF